MNARVQNPAQTLAPDRAEQPIGQIAVALPGSTAVFRRLKLDFCCGGQVSLREAAAGRGVDLAALLQELAALERPSTEPAPLEPAALIDHILTRFHAVHRQQLPELIRMARRVEAVHRDHPEVPAGLADLLEQAEQELLDHMEKEEQVLFPIMKAGGNPMVIYPIRMMRTEHTSHGAMLEQLLSRAHDARPPEGACNTWRALYAGVAQLADDLIAHIHLENNVLFPSFEAQAQAGSDSCSGTSGGCGCAG